MKPLGRHQKAQHCMAKRKPQLSRWQPLSRMKRYAPFRKPS